MYTQLAATQEDNAVLRQRAETSEATARHALEALAELKSSPYVDPPFDTPSGLTDKQLNRNVQELKDAHRIFILQVTARVLAAASGRVRACFCCCAPEPWNCHRKVAALDFWTCGQQLLACYHYII